MSDLQVRGPLYGGTGSPAPFTAAFSGAQRTADAHGRFAQAAMEGRLFSIGSGTTALSANTVTLTNTTTPIVGVWNPASNDKWIVIAQASVQLFINTVTTPVGAGPFQWASSVGNAALTLGSAPYNRKTMTSTGSAARGFPGGVALTGITNNLVVFAGAHFGNNTSITHGTIGVTVVLPSTGGVQNFDGNLIVPPGGLLCLLNTTSTTTMSVTAELIWEEIPIFT